MFFSFFSAFVQKKNPNTISGEAALSFLFLLRPPCLLSMLSVTTCTAFFGSDSSWCQFLDSVYSFYSQCRTSEGWRDGEEIKLKEVCIAFLQGASVEEQSWC